MISEFQQLSQKIEQLAMLAQQLRSENAELRLQISSLRAENASANERIHLAYQRVTSILDKLPPEPIVEPEAEDLPEELAELEGQVEADGPNGERK